MLKITKLYLNLLKLWLEYSMVIYEHSSLYRLYRAESPDGQERCQCLRHTRNNRVECDQCMSRVTRKVGFSGAGEVRISPKNYDPYPWQRAQWACTVYAATRLRASVGLIEKVGQLKRLCLSLNWHFIDDAGGYFYLQPQKNGLNVFFIRRTIHNDTNFHLAWGLRLM